MLRPSKICTVLLLCAAVLPSARAEIGLLIEQPYGRFGALSPTGHAAIYLSRVCAETPTRLRRCRPGESGAVISRYSQVGHYDWAAIPLVPYLYAVERIQQIPASIDKATVAQLRDRYRRLHLEGVVPDGPGGQTPSGEWTELVGGAYIRQIFVYEMETTAAQDDRLIRMLNARSNHRKFNFFFRNCANFAESVLNFYYPHSVHRSFSADLGLTTPKQIAKSLEGYAREHRDLQFSVFEIPQVSGKIERSGKICGVVEALLKKKQYALPLVIMHPYVAVALLGTYVARGRFNPARNAVLLDRSNEVQALLEGEPPPLVPKNSPAQVEKVSIGLNYGVPSKNCVWANPCSGLDPSENDTAVKEQ